MREIRRGGAGALFMWPFSYLSHPAAHIRHTPQPG